MDSPILIRGIRTCPTIMQTPIHGLLMGKETGIEAKVNIVPVIGITGVIL